MKFGDAVGLSSRLVALSGLLALILTFESALWLVVPAALLVLAGMLMPGRFKGSVLPSKAVTPLAVFALSFSVVDFFYIGGSLLLAGADFLVLLMCIRLFSLRENKDYVQLFAVSFYMLLASTGLSTEIYFLPAFLIFFVSLVWALILLTIKGEAEGLAGRPPRWRVGVGFFGGAAALTLAATVLTTAIFLIIPRVGIGYFSRKAGGLLKVSGFSDRVELGSMGKLKLDPTTVMRVEIAGAGERPGGGLYWRGRAFDRYTGKSWEDTLDTRLDLEPSSPGFFSIKQGYPAPKDAVVQNVVLEPLETDTIFALYPVHAVSGDLRRLQVDPSGGLHLPFSPGTRLRYTAYSSPRRPTPSELGSEGPLETTGGMSRYLDLPPETGELARLAVQVTAGAKNEYEKAEAVMRYLGRNFSYTLKPPRDIRYSIMDDFLFHGRAGYCEHFATAMVLMLRAAGVPARLVSGFAGGQWNGYGGYLLVREQDAHTWVEVYFPKSGWVVFDPTPSAASAGPSPFFPALTGLLDYVSYRWDRYVVYYTLRDQVVALKHVADAYQKASRGWDKINWPELGSVKYKGGLGRLAVIVGILAFAAAAAYLIRLGLGRIAAPGRRTTVPFYAEMSRLLEKKGLPRPPGDTPMEFADRVAHERGKDYEGVVYLTALYNRVRFGGLPAAPAERARVKEIIRKLRQA